MRSRDRNHGWLRSVKWTFCFFLAAMPASAVHWETEARSVSGSEVAGTRAIYLPMKVAAYKVDTHSSVRRSRVQSPPPSDADWETATRSESRIVFSGPEVAGTIAIYRYLPFRATDYKVETHSSVWESRVQSLPILFVRLNEAAPGYHFRDYPQIDLRDFVRSLITFKDKALSFGGAGSATTALGKAEYLVFATDDRECAVFRQFDLTAASDDVGTRGRIRLWGFHCPKSGSVGADGIEALLARVGVRGVAVPKMAPPQGFPDDSLIRAIETGDIETFRKIATGGFGPETSIQFSHPDFAGGRIISGPVLSATVLFGRVEMTKLLLSKGASVRRPRAPRDLLGDRDATSRDRRDVGPARTESGRLRAMRAEP